MCSQNGKDYLVTVDYYSNFAEVDRLSKTTSKSVIKRLKQHFARHGIPDTLITDNGPQFSASSFESLQRNGNSAIPPPAPGIRRLTAKRKVQSKRSSDFSNERSDREVTHCWRYWLSGTHQRKQCKPVWHSCFSAAELKLCYPARTNF